MAQTPFSLLLLRRLSLSYPGTGLSRSFTAIKPISASYSSSLEPSLSARMTFVFDQIDALEQERSEKDETAHRIRAWRESKKAQTPDLNSDLSTVSDSVAKSEAEVVDEAKAVLEFVHPWPEWVELMERLVQQNYFDHRRLDEGKMVKVVGFNEAHDATGSAFKNFRLAHDAFIKLGKDRFDVFRSVSGQDIQTLVGFGCPISDKKVVFASKLLRKHVHLDEGDVCSSCSLRNTCPSAFLISKREDEARCVDMMRVLFTYGFDPHNKARINPSVMKQKAVKTVVRKLLHQVVKLISVPIDPSLPPPIIKKRIPKVKQPSPPPRRRVGRDDVEMKKGDWICPKCDFMNFSKNTVCLQCDAKPPKRQLLPGEWECPQCNFLNYRRNVVCFHCDCKRPPDEYTENKMQESQQGPRARAGGMAYRPEGIKAWNFDFDDDESDGADVAAFEYADSSAMKKGPFDQQPEPDLTRAISRGARGFDEEFSDDDTGRPSTGFNDFADEEDDVDSYEIDDGISSPVKTRVSPDDFPKFESEAIARSDNNFHGRGLRSNPIHGRKAFSGSDDSESDSDSEISARPHPCRAPNSQSYKPKSRAFSGSDDDELDTMDDPCSRNLGSKQGGRGNDFHGRGSPRMRRDSFSGSEDEDEDPPRSYGNNSRGSAGPRRGAGNSRGRGNSESTRDRRSGSSGRRNSYDDDDEDEDENFRGPSRGSRGRGSRGRSDVPRMNDRNIGSGGRRNSFVDEDKDFGGSSSGFRGRGSRGKSGWSRMNDGNGRTRSSSGFGKRDFDGGSSGKQRGRGRDYSQDAGNAHYKNSRRVIDR